MTPEQVAKIQDIKEVKIGGSGIETKSSVELIATLYEIEEDEVVKEACREKLENILAFMVDNIDWNKVDQK